MIKKIGEANIEEIINELLVFEKDWQMGRGLQGHFKDESEDGNGAIAELKYPEHEYTKSTFLNIIPYTYSILEKYKMYRSRVMSLPKGKML